MKRVLVSIVVILMRILYFFIRLLPTKENKITLISRESDSETLDFRLLREALEDRDMEVVVLCKVLRNKFVYAPHLVTQMIHIATSKVVVLDTYCIPISTLRHKKSLKVIQIWHAAAAVKKFGLQLVDRLVGVDPVVATGMHMHSNYDYVFAPSKATGAFFCEAFGCDESQLVYQGLPRLQYISEDDEKMRLLIATTYPEINNGKKNILYAPTFRYNAPLKTQELADRIDTSKYNLIIKMHPLDNYDYDADKLRGVILDKSFDTYDLLKVSDILISDYSSLLVEATVRNMPIYMYVYDYDVYRLRTGLNIDFDYEPIGKYRFLTAESLAKALEEEYDMEALKAFRDKYIEVNYKDTIRRMTYFIKSLAKEDN